VIVQVARGIDKGERDALAEVAPRAARLEIGGIDALARGVGVEVEAERPV